jgi:hypothetical protein
MKKKNLITRIATLEKELAEMKRERDMLIENTPEEALAIAEIKARYNMRKDMQHFDDRIHETIMSRRRDGDSVLIAAGLFNQIDLRHEVQPAVMIPSGLSDKPPLGLRPKYISDSDRADEIMAAIHRYEAAGKTIPEAWYVELGKLLYKPKQ